MVVRATGRHDGGDDTCGGAARDAQACSVPLVACPAGGFALSTPVSHRGVLHTPPQNTHKSPAALAYTSTGYSH